MEHPSPMTKHARESKAFKRIPFMNWILLEAFWFTTCICFELFSHGYADLAIRLKRRFFSSPSLCLELKCFPEAIDWLGVHFRIPYDLGESPDSLFGYAI